MAIMCYCILQKLAEIFACVVIHAKVLLGSLVLSCPLNHTVRMVLVDPDDPCTALSVCNRPP